MAYWILNCLELMLRKKYKALTFFCIQFNDFPLFLSNNFLSCLFTKKNQFETKIVDICKMFPSSMCVCVSVHVYEKIIIIMSLYVHNIHLQLSQFSKDINFVIILYILWTIQCTFKVIFCLHFKVTFVYLRVIWILLIWTKLRSSSSINSSLSFFWT